MIRNAAQSSARRSQQGLNRATTAAPRCGWLAIHRRPEWVGRDLIAIASAEGSIRLEIVDEVMRHGDAQAISFGMSEDDVRLVMQQPFVATASDGSAHPPGGDDRPHPRSYGTFPRKLRYATDEKVLTLEQAVHTSSGLPASILGLPDRGVIRPGAFADLVVFDPKTIRDTATFDDPTRYAEGVVHLFVNGVATIRNGEYRDVLAGRALRLNEDGPADLILKVGRIWTGDPANPGPRPWPAGTATIVAVGATDDAMRFRGPRTRVLDRPEGFALPGLIDAHGHMSMLGSTVDWIDLRGASSPEAVAQQVSARLKDVPGDGWVLGRNWDQSLWPGQEFATAAALDAVAPDRPVWLLRVDGHAGWANAEAMRRAGVTAGPGRPKVGRSSATRTTARPACSSTRRWSWSTHAIPAAVPGGDRRHRLLAAQDRCARRRSDRRPRRRPLDPGDRRLPRTRPTGPVEAPGLRYGLTSGRRCGRFVQTPPTGDRSRAGGSRMRAIKLFIDGAMGSRGALLFEPYADDPGNTGLQLIAGVGLARTTTEAL